ncbi:hypothetical protein LDZ77_03015 [Bacteroides xylanisolvens]|uniref:DUF4251 domain-containing protein n=1 Tax=Bacteroides xylanisolvens TaxID=371601 RepID=A0AAW4SU62_9BACE|nr:hypothetical protein [Bacteroides xylanisolvens]MCA4531502.1 hypothetical protein [Bacteroides xylanisolvens]MCA4549541.1 hypothetical protein [Bacteroides xylanisolvens]MCA4562834.1 hypothetical protein [Bacteroides xylanisolvens]MCA4567920.1 hypothetical protein [Bacteroides xylanisolvens]MCA4598442.1 hypothetical protein [Bacteroides xylanisolvens]
MHRKTLILLMLFASLTGAAQTTNKSTTTSGQNQEIITLLSKIDTLMAINNELLEHLEINTSLKGRYKLYKTDNIYTFLQLDTKTGKIDQVQWSLDSDKEGSMTINSDDLSFGMGYGSGSFELYPTQNIYQFILIDKTDGRKWHVQWGLSETKRWIRRMY